VRERNGARRSSRRRGWWRRSKEKVEEEEEEQEEAAGFVEEVGWLWWELTSWVGVGGIDFDIMPGASMRCSDE
jgi:hypothetical protein